MVIVLGKIDAECQTESYKEKLSDERNSDMDVAELESEKLVIESEFAMPEEIIKAVSNCLIPDYFENLYDTEEEVSA